MYYIYYTIYRDKHLLLAYNLQIIGIQWQLSSALFGTIHCHEALYSTNASDINNPKHVQTDDPIFRHSQNPIRSILCPQYHNPKSINSILLYTKSANWIKPIPSKSKQFSPNSINHTSLNGFAKIRRYKTVPTSRLPTRHRRFCRRKRFHRPPALPRRPNKIRTKNSSSHNSPSPPIEFSSSSSTACSASSAARSRRGLCKRRGSGGASPRTDNSSTEPCTHPQSRRCGSISRRLCHSSPLLPPPTEAAYASPPALASR